MKGKINIGAYLIACASGVFYYQITLPAIDYRESSILQGLSIIFIIIVYMWIKERERKWN